MLLIVVVVALLLPFASSLPPATAEQWADLAFDFVSSLSCGGGGTNLLLSTQEECERLVALPKGAMTFHAALPAPGRRYRAALHDGHRADARDAVLVIDPYPAANLGHLIVVLFVDLHSSGTPADCSSEHGGRYSAGFGCLSLALRKRCHNLQVNGKWRGAEYLKHCEINFFPLVYFADEEPTQKSQKLQCIDLISGFGACPPLRPLPHTQSLFCDALESNTYACRGVMGGRCRIFERCDHAVLLSGGFDRLSDSPRYFENMVRFHEMLRLNGFPHHNVKMFYSNGNQDIDENLGIKDEVYPSSAKLAMRNHIGRICQTYHCADSFVLYLNSPTRNDGASLLWDVDRDGQIDESEVYSVRELLQDLQDCAARQVVLVADQNFSGKIVSALQHSKRHLNVLAFASGGEHEYAWDGEFSRLWTTYNRDQECVTDIHEGVRRQMNSSQPLSYDGTLGALNTTLYGAPCDVMPPFTDHELERRYFGCQNLPTSVWLRRRTFNY